jgi:hypothetical protein
LPHKPQVMISIGFDFSIKTKKALTRKLKSLKKRNKSAENSIID